LVSDASNTNSRENAMSTTTVLSQLAGDWDLDPSHTGLRFSARHAMVATVRGGFKAFSGSLHFDADDVAKSTAEVTIDATSVDTGTDGRDDHLRSADFFDVEKYPTITFSTTRVEQVDDENFLLVGDLTIKDVTKEVSIKVEFLGLSPDPWGNTRAGFEGKGEINRKDWGLEWNAALETGGVLVSDKVKLTLDVSAVKRAQA
jgi:polyisoprenoid-binding protein YceI